MSLMGKLEGEIEIKSSVDKFHEVWSCRPHHVSNITPEKVQACDLHEGDFGSSGSVIAWSYVHDGKAKVAKQLITIDDENNSVTFKMIEGDLMTEYKSFILIVSATPKGEGSLVHWTFEYEKLNEDVPEPKTLMEYLLNVSKDIDAHLCQA